MIRRPPRSTISPFGTLCRAGAGRCADDDAVAAHGVAGHADVVAGRGPAEVDARGGDRRAGEAGGHGRGLGVGAGERGGRAVRAVRCAAVYAPVQRGAHAAGGRGALLAG